MGGMASGNVNDDEGERETLEGNKGRRKQRKKKQLLQRRKMPKRKIRKKFYWRKA
ncbi:hypothetical protein [Pasteurella multocida]|uniref:hypothetical protein n=1 Tax=Pasteurella multocida TaxID=747 RepID=UPI001461464A|nr:hypothetical protein [Pasteurella multocida]NMR52191.1 hypothetical protein [Pasteurella multocida]NMR62131.1 hypothetical protein [Pasteurella multocida]